MGQCLSDGAGSATHDTRGNLMRERKEGIGTDVFDLYEKVGYSESRSSRAAQVVFISCWISASVRAELFTILKC